MSKPFHFKQFTVRKELCAMKVGTDGVLLGAWAKLPKDASHVLDIGTGSGVIALMLTQRFPQLAVTAIDIEPQAVAQASENFRESLFSDRLKAMHIGIQDFDTQQQFEGIVSNPPFFTAGILPENEQRKLARHTAAFSFEILFAKVSCLLSKSGVFSMIAPKSEEENLVAIATQQHLHLRERCTVYPNSEKPAKRVLLSFSRKKGTVSSTEIIIETDTRHTYTEAYKKLLKDFYLAF